MTTLLDHLDTRSAPAATGTTTTPAQRLRSTMAAARVSFTWFGVQKTLTREQKALAADEAFDAEGGSSSCARQETHRHQAYSAFRAPSRRSGARSTPTGRARASPYSSSAGVRLIRRRRRPSRSPSPDDRLPAPVELDDAVANLARIPAPMRRTRSRRPASGSGACSTRRTIPRPWSDCSGSNGGSPRSSRPTTSSRSRRGCTRPSGRGSRPGSRRPSSSPSRRSSTSSRSSWRT